MVKAKSKRYFGCVQIMRYLAEERLTNQCTRETLTAVITVMKGGDPRTIASWTRSLRLFKMITVHDRNPSLLNLHFDMVPEVLPVLVKQGQKRLL